VQLRARHDDAAPRSPRWAGCALLHGVARLVACRRMASRAAMRHRARRAGRRRPAPAGRRLRRLAIRHDVVQNAAGCRAPAHVPIPTSTSEDPMKRIPFVFGAALLAACAAGDTAADSAAGDSAAVPAAAAPADADPDAATAGGGVPAGYLGQVDLPRPGRDTADLAQASYAMRDGRWEVRTGPAHIVYAGGDSASGAYTVSATVEQLETPSHPEAFGLILGGANLDQLAAQKYTYFIVRHTGEYMVRVRDGAATRDVIGWTASPGVPKSDDGGRATYNLSARVGADSVRFLVNDQQVAAVAAAAVPTSGIAGLRINHNLHLMVTPPRITRN
jgi:hypothetical protein